MSPERMTGLAVFDADGTLIDRSHKDVRLHHIPDQTRKGLRSLRGAGSKTTVCTSNGISEMMYKLSVLEQSWGSTQRTVLSPKVPMGISSGANIIDQRGRSLHSQIIPPEYLDAIAYYIPFLTTGYVAITTIPAHDPKGKVEVTDFFCHTPEDFFYCKERYTVRSRLHYDKGGLGGFATQFLFAHNPIVVTVKLNPSAFAVDIPREIPHHMHHSGYIDFFAPGTSKLNAAERIADHLGLPLVAVGGDDRNDVSFFRHPTARKFAVGPRIANALAEAGDINLNDVDFLENPHSLGLLLQAIAASGNLFEDRDSIY